MKTRFFFLILSSVTILAQANNLDTTSKEFQTTSAFYEKLISGSAPYTSLLNLFFTNMPKGGDLHHHYSGTIYAETYLDWVKRKNWKIDKCSLKIITDNLRDSCELITVEELLQDNALYRKLLSLWSDKDYKNHFHNQPPPDENFFNTFGYFSPVSNEYMGEGLKILKNRAVDENVQYIETMLNMVGVSSDNYPNKKSVIELLRNASTQKEVDDMLNSIDQYYKQDKDFQNQITQFVDNVEKIHEGIDDVNFTMRYQSYCVRVMDPLEVYTDLLAAYIASNISNLVVGVNIVAPENNYIALRDYLLHMKMYNYLSRKYPNVGRALHAGELTLGMVRPKNLTFHIQEALHTAKAQRIGHGVDIPYENNSIELLKNLRKSAVIEINLTSNEFILGVKDNEHPYLIYNKYGVPMVISTDDSGVSRNNLSKEYVLLASRYKPSYKEIKKHVYNSIMYSFLNDEEKEKGQKQLYKKFQEFEKLIMDFNDKIH